MQGRLRKSIGELLMDVGNDDAPQAALDNAPPGHFPAYITPDEADLLRSEGGGVASDGGQYMVNGIPAFFSEADPNPGVASDGGSAMGFEDFGFMHTAVEEDEAAWEGAVAAGMSGLEGFTAMDEGDMGRSYEDQVQDFLQQQSKKANAAAAVQAEDDAAAAAAAANAAANAAAAAQAEDDAQAAAQAQAQAQAQAAAQAQAEADAKGFAEMDAAIAAAQAQAEAETSGMPTTEEEAKGITAFQQAIDLDEMEREANILSILERSAVAQKTFKENLKEEFKPRLVQVQKQTKLTPKETRQYQRQNIEAKAKEAIEGRLQDKADAKEEGREYAYSAYDDDQVAAIMAYNALSLENDPDMTDEEGNLTALGLAQAGKDFSKGGFGSMSPAGFNANFSETARTHQNAVKQGTLSETDPSKISVQSLVDLNAVAGISEEAAWNPYATQSNPTKGWDINEPQPTAAGILASHHWGRYNPTMTNALFGIGSLVPGPAGMVAQAAGIKEGKGFGPLAMQAIENVPVIGDLATDFQGWLGEVGTQLGGLLPGQGALGGLMAATDQGQDLSLADMPDFGEAPGEGEPEGPGDPVFEYSSPPLPEDVVVGPQPQQPQPQEEERPLLAAGPLLSPLLPPALPLAPAPTFAAANLPPVFTEEDARALLQRSGQLPFAGIV